MLGYTWYLAYNNIIFLSIIIVLHNVAYNSRSILGTICNQSNGYKGWKGILISFDDIILIVFGLVGYYLNN